MASVLEEILEWSATRPLWQQDALRRIVAQGQIGDDAIETYTTACMGSVELRDDLRAKTTAAQLARQEAFSEAPLDGVGGTAWRILWEASRNYSELAYPDRMFPVVEDAVCLLCQQPVGNDAAARLRGFEEFVRNTTQQAAEDAQSTYSARRRKVDELVVVTETTADILADLRAEDASVADRISAYLGDAERAVGRLRKLDEATQAGEPLTFPEPPTEFLGEAIAALRDRGEELVKGSEPEGATALLAELAELRGRKALADGRNAVAAERDRLRLVANVTAARSQASTNAITQKSAELTEKALTEVLVDRFTRETDRLGLEHVTLRTVGGRRGVLRYRAGFVGATQEVPLPEVLSEGEPNSPFSRPCLEALWVVEENRQVRALFRDEVGASPNRLKSALRRPIQDSNSPANGHVFMFSGPRYPPGYLPGERIQPAGELPQPRAQHGREPGIWSASRPSSSRRARCSQRRTAASLYGRARTGTETTGAVGCRSSAEAPPAQFPAPAPRRPCREGQPKAPLEKAVEPELRLTPGANRKSRRARPARSTSPGCDSRMTRR